MSMLIAEAPVYVCLPVRLG